MEKRGPGSHFKRSGSRPRGQHGYRHSQTRQSSQEWKDRNPERSKQQNRNNWWNQTPGRSYDEPQPSSSAAANSTEESDDLEIPGFYYDKEKKRYFKILPGHSNVNGAITQQSVKEKKNEEYRQQKVKELMFDCSPTFSQSSKRSHKCPYFSTAPFLLGRRDLGSFGCDGSSFETIMQKRLVSHLRPKAHMQIFENPFNTYEKLEHMTHLVPNTDHTKALCLWSLKGLIVQRIQVLDLNRIERTEQGELSLSIKPSGAVVLQSFSKVTNICWAPMAVSSSEVSPFVLYTTTCFIGNNPSLALLRHLESTTMEDFRLTEFNLGKKATWTCAWNKHSKRFSVGSEGMGLIIDVETRRMWEMFTKRGDVFAQIFSNETGQTLFSGTRKGSVCIHDLRSTSTKLVSSLSHKSSVCHLRLLQDENYLIAADFSTKIRMWDLRQQSVVQEFHGHNNEYSRIPFQVDEREKILYSAGQDCFTRFWDLQSGQLLHTIPPPHKASRDTIPSLLYSINLTGGHSLPGLLMGIHDEIHYYS